MSKLTPRPLDCALSVVACIILFIGMPIAAGAAQHNVALASHGAYITADSNGRFGRDIPVYGPADPHSGPGRLIRGTWLHGPLSPNVWHPGWGKRWISAVDNPPPHWVWIHFNGMKRIDRVVLHCSSMFNYPTDFSGQYSDDRGVTTKTIFEERDMHPSGKGGLTMTIDFKPVVTDNFRLWITKSASRLRNRYTQLSAIQVFGTDASAPASVAAATNAGRLQLRLLKPLAVDGLIIKQTPETLSFSSRWLRVVFDRDRPKINFISWDSDGRGKTAMNFLEQQSRGGIQPRIAPAYLPPEVATGRANLYGDVVQYGPFAAGPGITMVWAIRVGLKGLEMETAVNAQHAMRIRPGVIRVDFESGKTPVAPFYRPGTLSFVGLPCLLNAPDWGTLLVTSPDTSVAGMHWTGAQYATNQTWEHLDLSLTPPKRPGGLVILPRGVSVGKTQWTVVKVVRPITIRGGLAPAVRATHLGRYILNGLEFRPDTNLLSNSVDSINCAFCMWEFANAAQFTPTLPGNVNACDLLRRTLNAYFAGTPAHDAPDASIFSHTYWTSYDTKPALMDGIWTVVFKTGDKRLLQRWLPDIQRLARLMQKSIDKHGLMESDISGTTGVGWYDTYNVSGENAAENAMGYKAFGEAADLEALAGRARRAAHYRALAARIKQAFLPRLFDPKASVIAGWRGFRGHLHDYWFPWINGLAIDNGLVPEPLARQILGRFQAKLKAMGFKRYNLGMPNCLEAIPKPYYVVPNKFGQYLNGGVTPCFTYFYIQALYRVGMRREANAILAPLMQSFSKGLFNGGYCYRRGTPDNGEWHLWNGERYGAEGYLVDCYDPLTALWTGRDGVVLTDKGYELTPWSPYRNTPRKVKLNLTFMGRPAALTP